MTEKITNLYVTYMTYNGGIECDCIEVNGKVNHYTVTKALKNSLSYYGQDNLRQVLCWSEEEEFTPEERDEFWENY